MVPEEVVEFKNVLEQITEGKETAIDCPSPVCYSIAFVAHNDNTCWYRLGSRGWIFVEPYDLRIRDTIQETEARKGDR
jgi:hypothetical protein